MFLNNPESRDTYNKQKNNMENATYAVILSTNTLIQLLGRTCALICCSCHAYLWRLLTCLGLPFKKIC